MQRRTILKAAAGAALYPAAAARAQQWPSNTMRWIVPFLPGTGPDITVRVVAEAMADILMQPVVVENRAGAAGMIGARLAARAPADGYHWVYTATPMASNMRMYKAPGFDVLKDFAHVSRLSNSDVMLVVNPESGIRSVGELVERMRQNPGKFDYGSGGVGSPNHLGAELLLAAAGVQATHVPFKGTVDAVNSVIGRQIDFCLPLVQVGLPHVASGRLRALPRPRSSWSCCAPRSHRPSG
jgi:tripartite-type tricarboxylate transporter receptor subunit TctC